MYNSPLEKLSREKLEPIVHEIMTGFFGKLIGPSTHHEDMVLKIDGKEVNNVIDPINIQLKTFISEDAKRFMLDKKEFINDSMYSKNRYFVFWDNRFAFTDWNVQLLNNMTKEQIKNYMHSNGGVLYMISQKDFSVNCDGFDYNYGKYYINMLSPKLNNICTRISI